MEASVATTLPKKKNTISKGKIKKSLKNVLCRPDQVFWPEITETEGKGLESVLKNHKIHLPVFKKSHWKELEKIPKDKRPKPPKLKKVEGLLLGIRECCNSIQNGECSAIVIEAKVNPRLIVQPLLQMCSDKAIPYLCLPDLRKCSATYFGITTSCLGIKTNHLLDVTNEIVSIAKCYPIPKQTNEIKQINNNVNKVEKMDICNKDIGKNNTFTFLYRKSKKERVFVPTTQDNEVKSTKQFIGQDFIEFSGKPEDKSKTYLKMIVKRITNNPDRVKKK